MKPFQMKMLALGVLCFLLTGCWDIKTIQDINYVTALGIDYEDGQYVIYAQVLDFSNVAKQETGGKPNQPAPVYVGKAYGSDISGGLNNMYRAAEQRMFWGHISAIVLGQGVLNRGVPVELFDNLIRFREIRYTQWVFGTKEPLDRLLSITPFFNLSPISSILHQPKSNYRQHSMIKPINFQAFISQYREPGKDVQLPSIAITTDAWTRDEKPNAQFYYDGIYAMRKVRPAVWFSMDNMLGLRWLDTKTVRSPIHVHRNGKTTLGTVMCEEPKPKIRYREEGGNIIFDLQVDMKSDVVEQTNIPSGIEEMQKLAEAQIAEEIKTAFQAAKQRNRDVFQLEHLVYRESFPIWRRLTNAGERELTQIALGEVKVRLHMAHTGMYRERKYVDFY